MSKNEYIFRVKKNDKKRISLCTKKVRNRYCEAIKNGLNKSSAAIFVRISSQTIHKWLKKGEEIFNDYESEIEKYLLSCEIEGKEPDLLELESISIDINDADYVQFYLDVLNAESSLERFCTESWISHFEKDWRAVKEFLSVRFPENWNKDKKDSNDENKNNVSVNFYLPDNSRD